MDQTSRRKKNRKTAFWTLGMLAAILLYACENDMQKVADFGRRTQLPEDAHQVDIYLSQSGKMKARLQAPFMLRYNDTPRIVFPQTLHSDFYDSLLTVSSYLDARYGVYYETMNKVYLNDHVKIVNVVKKDTIYCEDLYWDQNAGQFYTHRKVEIHQPTQTIIGKGLNANEDFSDVKIDTISGIVQVRNGQLP